jgi:hypothetical protein
MKRRVYIEFVNKSRVRITNYLRQAEIDLALGPGLSNFIIDLVSLKTSKVAGLRDLEFYAYVKENLAYNDNTGDYESNGHRMNIVAIQRDQEVSVGSCVMGSFEHFYSAGNQEEKTNSGTYEITIK